tara:strand:+ start:11084 stop:12265 length:1182 start_codon:yes stop_codon:yes gene_type:complete
MNKTIQRFLPILTNGTRSIISPLISIAFAFVIVKYFSKQLWGEFVDIFLFMLILTLFSSWGNKNFLLRQFSKKPREIVSSWQYFFTSRFPILVICILSILLNYNLIFSLWLSFWLVSSYIFQSFFSVLIYRRDFGKAILFELLSFSCLLGFLFFYRDVMNLGLLVQLYAIYHIVKAFLFSLPYLAFFKFKSIRIDFSLLLSGSIFFLLGVAGFLQSKVDVYVLQSQDDVVALGEYQVISGFFIFCQTIPTILILPYLKNIYRMSSKSVITIKNLIAILGIFINSIAVIFVYFILKTFFEIELNSYQIIAGFMISYPPYIYSIYVFDLFKKSKEKKVLKICILCSIINLIISLVFVHLNYSITGLLYANAFSQLVCLFAYTQFKINDKDIKKHQ